MSASQTRDDERLIAYDDLIQAAGAIGELRALFDAMNLMRSQSGNEENIRRLICIGQNIAGGWLTYFEDEATRLKAMLPKGAR